MKDIRFAVGKSPVINLEKSVKLGIHLQPDRLAKQLGATLATEVSANDAMDAIVALGISGFLRVKRGKRGEQFEMCGRPNSRRARKFIDLSERPVEAAFGNN